MLSNGRGVGVTELLQGYTEWPVVLLFAVITQLGDVWFLFLLSSVLYVTGGSFGWRIDRREGLFVVALVLTYIVLINVLKTFFLLPRPPGAVEPAAVHWIPSALGSVVNNITTAEGPGFPSGHALGSTLVWGGLALVLRRRTFRSRVSAAGVIVGSVSVSRLVLGVHYAVDVVVGVVLGVVVLGCLYWLADHGTNPERALVIAVLIGILGLFLDLTFDSVAAAGGAAGAWIAWRGVAERTAEYPTTSQEVIIGIIVLGITGGLFGVVYTLKSSFLLTFLATALTAGGIVGAPMLGERLA